MYRYTHQLFYQDNAIYFLLFDLSRSKQDNLAETEHWILDIVSRMRIASQSKPNYRIYLIGTHCDRVSPQIAEEKYSFVVSSVKQSHPSLSLCSSSSSSSPFIISVPKKIGIDNLFDVLEMDADGFLQFAPAIIERVRASCLHLPSDSPSQLPILKWSEFGPRLLSLGKTTKTKDIELMKTQLAIVDVLEKLGTITAIHSHVPHSPPLSLVLRPQWIVQLIATVVTQQNLLVGPNGIMLNAKLKEVWERKQIPQDTQVELFLLLQQLDVLIAFGEGRSLVPSMLPDSLVNIDIVWPKQSSSLPFSLCREYWLIERTMFVRSGLIARLICRLGSHFRLLNQWKSGLIGEHEDFVFKIEMQKKEEYGGLLCCGDASSPPPLTRFVVSLEIRFSASSFHKIAAQQLSSLHLSFQQTYILRNISSMIENLLQGFYSIPFITTVKCPRGPSCYFVFSSCGVGGEREDDFSSAVKSGRETVCCQPHRHEIVMKEICPDIYFVDVEGQGEGEGEDRGGGKFVFDFEKDLDWSNKKTLGKGSFGMVELAHLRSSDVLHPLQPVAVKYQLSSSERSGESDGMCDGENVDEGEEKKFSESENFVAFQNEARVMSALKSPHVVRLFGITLQPPALIMEVLEGGDLYVFLNDPLHFNNLQSVIDVFKSISSGSSPSFGELRETKGWKKIVNGLDVWRSRVLEEEFDGVATVWGEIAGEVEVCLANKQQSSRMAELMDMFLRYYESQLDVITNTHEFPFLFRSPSFRVVVDVMLSFLT